MSSLIRRTHFLVHENVKLLRYIGGWTLNHCSRDNMLKTNALIAFYSAMGSDCDQMNKQNISVSQSALITRHFLNGSAFDDIRLFKSMVSEPDESWPLNEYEYVSAVMLKSCIQVEYVLFGRQGHGYLLKSGLVFHQYVKRGLLHLYCMLSDVVGAFEVLVSVPGLDTGTYNLLSVGPGENSYLDEAFNILRKMFADDMVWNKASYLGILGLCARLKYQGLGIQVHNKLLKSDVEFDVSVCNALLKMYVSCGDLANALTVLDTFEARNVVSYTTMMAGSSEQGYFEDLFLFFSDMQLDNLVPNESVFAVLLNASAELFSMTYGSLLHALAEKTGFRRHKKVGDALISMYLRTGDVKAAKKVFLSMTTYNRDIVTLNMMICGYCLHWFGNESLALFQEMLKLGEDPNCETFVGVLSACGRLGLVEEGYYYMYELMKQKGVVPGLDHYRCIMNILVKAGRLDEAFNYMVSTPIKLDATAWSTLLCARDAHRYNISARVAELLPLPDDVATKVSERFGVANFRELMEIRNDIKIEPGLSWVEVNKQIYKFVSLVNGDPEFVKFHNKIKPLFASIKADAYVPDTGNLLPDVIHVEDEMKEDCDGYHSEQLAVAYALLKAHDMAPICIINASGKTCHDCHSLMKLISKARKRLITLRDVTGFHHFQDGICSCADYW